MNGLTISILSFIVLLQSSDSTRLGFGDGNSGNNGDRQVDDVENHMIGEEIVKAGEFPFFVQWRGCGASLIHGDILLTAAHCEPIGSSDVLVGAYTEWTVEGDPVNSTARKIVERRVHPLWSKTTLQYDIMVMKLDEKVDLPVVRLYSGSEDFGVGLTVMGFGTAQPRIDVIYDDNLREFSVWNPFVAMEEAEYFDVDEIFSPRQEILQKVDVNQIDTDTCQEIFDGFVDENTMICAGTIESGLDVCFGDSGGPLISESSDGSIIQVGVISFGEGCAPAKKPGVYSLVSAAYDWIQDQICDMSVMGPSSCFPTTLYAIDPLVPSGSPSLQPTNFPSRRPTIPVPPSDQPSLRPTHERSSNPSSSPSLRPTRANVQPLSLPTVTKSRFASNQPTKAASSRPSHAPSGAPSTRPSVAKSLSPSSSPSLRPTHVTVQPSSLPTIRKSHYPSNKPSVVVSSRPSHPPSNLPSALPSVYKPRVNQAVPSTFPQGKTPPSSPPSFAEDGFEEVIDEILEESFRDDQV